MLWSVIHFQSINIDLTKSGFHIFLMHLRSQSNDLMTESTPHKALRASICHFICLWKHLVFLACNCLSLLKAKKKNKKKNWKVIKLKVLVVFLCLKCHFIISISAFLFCMQTYGHTCCVNECVDDLMIWLLF